jgi:hypothetical protein
MIAAAVAASGEFPAPHPSGRPRKHANGAARVREHRKRKRNESNEIPAPSCNETFVTASEASACNEICNETTPRRPPSDEMGRRRYELHTDPYLRSLRVRLIDAAHGNVDGFADLTPISMLIQQGCDLDLDILPIVAREVPELPRPLKKWGAPWLVRDILAAREARLAGHQSCRRGAS